MALHATLTVDLNGFVTAEARAIFNRVLAEHYYAKHKLTTLWTVQFTPNTTATNAERIVREHVALAANTAGIRNYEALVMLGEQPPIEWKKTDTSTNSLVEALMRFK
jgi:hypothetical protein